MSNSAAEIKFEILERSILDSIPGASGVAVHKSNFYIVGDNAPFLFEISLDGKLSERHQIHSLEHYKDQQIIKSLKPDFEAMELIEFNSEKEILIFGSGSKSPERDVFKRILPDRNFETQTFVISNFYKHLKDLEILQYFELNIEAVAENEGEIYLFNRGKNLIFLFNYQKFLKYLEGKGDIPEINVKEVELPQIKGLQAGFSGATVIPASRWMLITCSVEDTPNAYDDGEVLGSFVGIMDLNDLESGLVNSYLLDLEEGISEVKVESIAVSKVISEREVEIVMVTDSDGEDSELLRGHLQW